MVLFIPIWAMTDSSFGGVSEWIGRSVMLATPIVLIASPFVNGCIFGPRGEGVPSRPTRKLIARRTGMASLVGIALAIVLAITYTGLVSVYG